MEFTKILKESACAQWDEAVQKSFLREMAQGTLAPERFCSYMLQDYLYLQEYIRILQRTLEVSQSPGLRAFLQRIIKETENETYRVHVPNMKKAGVRDEDIAHANMAPEIAEYVGYMLDTLQNGGILAGLTALLQCSWVYAFIGARLTEAYSEEIAGSPYRSWFEAYACPEYLQANQLWIDAVNREAEGIGQAETRKLCDIFRTCAEYENRFWDSL